VKHQSIKTIFSFSGPKSKNCLIVLFLFVKKPSSLFWSDLWLETRTHLVKNKSRSVNWMTFRVTKCHFSFRGKKNFFWHLKKNVEKGSLEIFNEIRNSFLRNLLDFLSKVSFLISYLNLKIVSFIRTAKFDQWKLPQSSGYFKIFLSHSETRL